MFRAQERWAGFTVWACVAVMLSGLAIACATGDAEGASLENPGFWLEWTAQMQPAGWLCWEGFAHHRSARRRLRVGLSDPHVCNRFLLWGGASLATATIFFLTSTAVRLALSPADGAVTPGVMMLVSLLTLVTATGQWLAFLPPARYTRWIESRAVAAA